MAKVTIFYYQVRYDFEQNSTQNGLAFLPAYQNVAPSPYLKAP